MPGDGGWRHVKREGRSKDPWGGGKGKRVRGNLFILWWREIGWVWSLLFQQCTMFLSFFQLLFWIWWSGWWDDQPLRLAPLLLRSCNGGACLGAHLPSNFGERISSLTLKFGHGGFSPGHLNPAESSWKLRIERVVHCWWNWGWNNQDKCSAGKYLHLIYTWMITHDILITKWRSANKSVEFIYLLLY